MHVLDELSYTFDHTWTNLLTQCTPVPVPVFCCFSISVIPHLKSAPKIRKKSDKKLACRKPPEARSGARGPPLGAQAATWRDQGPDCARGAPGPLVAPLVAPFAYLFSVTGKLRRQNPISQSLLYSAAAALPRSGAPSGPFL